MLGPFFFFFNFYKYQRFKIKLWKLKSWVIRHNTTQHMVLLAPSFLWLIFHIDFFSLSFTSFGQKLPTVIFRSSLTLHPANNTQNQSMANTFSKVLVNTAHLAAKLLRNYKKVAVNKAFIPWQLWPDRCNKYKWLHRCPETRGAKSPCPINTPSRVGQTNFISETSDL